MGLAAMSLLIATRQKVATTVSSSLPAELVRGVSACAWGAEGGARGQFTLMPWEGGLRVTLFRFSQSLIVPTPFPDVNVT